MKVLQKFIAELDHPVFILNKSGQQTLYANKIALSKKPDLLKKNKPFNELIPIKVFPITKRKIAYLNKKWCEVTETDLAPGTDDVVIVELKPRQDIPDEDSIKNMNNMIQVMLHRLRSPLTGITGYLELMEEEDKNSILEKRFDSVNKGFNHIYTIMDDLEVLYNLPTEPAPDEYVSVDIHQAIHNVLIQFGKAERSRIKFLSANSFTLSGIEDSIKQALKLIITNALDYSDDSAITIEISIQNGGCITVKNKGSSIPKEIKKQIFYPFITTKANNLGIGLTKALFHTRRFGGTIFHEEDENTTYFHIQFPLLS